MIKLFVKKMLIKRKIVNKINIIKFYCLLNILKIFKYFLKL